MKKWTSVLVADWVGDTNLIRGRSAKCHPGGGETAVDVLLQVLPLVSAILWLSVGVWPILRHRLISPFERALTVFALLLGAWAFTDWVFFGLQDSALAIAVSNVRITIITFATLALLLAAKWLYFGHSRRDPWMLLPVAGSLLIIWGGLTQNAVPVGWGYQLVRDQLLYLLWAMQQMAYVGASTAFLVGLYLQRRDLPRRLRVRISLTAGSLLTIMALWLSTNIYNNLTQTAGVPWFSSLLSIPAALILVTFVPLSQEELGEAFRAVSAVETRVSALYVFYRTGEPLVALGSGRNLPIEPEQLQGILDLVGNFVETSMKEFRKYAVTAMHFDRLGIIAVRGQYLIVAAVHDGAAYDALRSEILRSVRAFEERRQDDLATWEGATRVAETLADELSMLLKLHERPQTSEEPRPTSKRGAAIPPAGRDSNRSR